MITGTLMEIDNCQIRGPDSQDTVSKEKPPDGCSWSGERLTRKQTTSRPDNVWPDMWKHMSDAAKRKAKNKSGLSRIRDSTMPEDCVVFTSLILMMKN